MCFSFASAQCAGQASFDAARRGHSPHQFSLLWREPALYHLEGDACFGIWDGSLNREGMVVVARRRYLDSF